MKKAKASALISLRRFPQMRSDDAGKSPLPAPPPMAPGLAKMIAKGEAQVRMDGWQNIISGAGVAGRDKRLGATVSWDGIMPEARAEQIYSGSKLARRIAEIVPQECLKNGIKFEGLEEMTEPVEEEMDRLKWEERFFEAAVWGNIYGGSAIFMATGEDPDDFKLPLDPRNFDKVESLVLFNRWELMVRSTDLETDINDPNYGQPKYYWLTPRKGNISTLFTVRIHHSRLIRFGGAPLPLRLKVFNRYWDDSIYTGCIEAMNDHALSHSSIASVLQEYRQVIYKIKELTDGLSSVDSAALMQRLATLNAVRSVYGAFFLDMDEEMEIKSDTFAGVGDMLQALKERLQTETDIPHTVLFNESGGSAKGGGLSSPGQDPNAKTWLSFLKGKQRNYFKPKIEQLLAAMLQAPAGPTQGQEPEGWKWDFNNIQDMDEGETEDLKTKKLSNAQSSQDLGIDSPLDTMKDLRPEKYRQMMQGTSPDVELQATMQQLVRSEVEKFGDPSMAPTGKPGGVTIPTPAQPLVRERDKVVVQPRAASNKAIAGMAKRKAQADAKAEKKPKK